MTAAQIGNFPVLLVDDEPALLASGSLVLRSDGIEPVITCADSREVLALLAKQPVGTVVVDLSMPHVSGQALLAAIGERHPEIPVIVMTGNGELDTAIACMKAGAADYLLKPVEPARLCTTVRRTLADRSKTSEFVHIRETMLRTSAQVHPAFAGTITQSPAMITMFRYLTAIAPSPHPVLITGESGTGKQLVAEAIHAISGREGRLHSPGVGLFSSDDARFSDELFGHVRGAFTHAERARPGHVVQAGAGTLFLDEIGDVPSQSQKGLLELLQTGKFCHVGSDEALICRARIIAATNCDLQQAIEEGRFRRDLFHRLESYHVHLPPLRERLGDLPALVHHFVGQEAALLGKPSPQVPPALFQLLGSYDFPGNIRELQAMVRHALATHEGRTLSLQAFRDRMISGRGRTRPVTPAPDAGPPSWLPERLPTLKEVKALLIGEALRRAGGNQGVAADMLGLTRQAVSYHVTRARRPKDASSGAGPDPAPASEPPG